MGTASRKTILLIDDVLSLLATVSDFLASEGYEVVTASSGEQGLVKLSECDPDLIVLDMSMPGMGGIGFLKRISDENGVPSHPVLVLTAKAEMAGFFANVAVDGFVTKPCDPDALLSEVARILFLRSGDKERGGDLTQSGGPVCVLLGEDDSGVAGRLRSAMEHAGYEVLLASRGPEVLEQAILKKPAVIVMKYTLRGMSGDSVAKMLQEMPNTKHVPVVLYDESDSAVDEATLKDAGIVIRDFVKSNATALVLRAVASVL